MLDPVLAAFGFPQSTPVTPFGNGLINRTWRLTSEKDDFILQRVNDDVFSDPLAIAQNIDQIGAWLQHHHPGAAFSHPLRSLDGQSMIHLPGQGFFRIYPFIRDSFTTDLVDTPGQAYEAAKKFGEFTHHLSGFPAGRLTATLPGFHDLSLRYRSFRESLKKGNPQRITKAATLIDYLESLSNLVEEYDRITRNPSFRLRVTHHDTKISNVLFDGQGKGLCVIDLDTVMPGYFISDLGDMFRTYLSPVTEEEADCSKILIRQPVFTAIVKGYLEFMRAELTPDEKKAFLYAGEFMMYMQSLRFLTDYLNDDIYYGSRYKGHNYVRALNQATLLQRFRELKPELNDSLSRSISL
jgi:Ser/Thr protein kinase RdoA (MazF antagonist)